MACAIRGSSPEAKFVSEDVKDERSSLVKSLDCWDDDLSSEPRDQKGMLEIILQ